MTVKLVLQIAERLEKKGVARPSTPFVEQLQAVIGWTLWGKGWHLLNHCVVDVNKEWKWVAMCVVGADCWQESLYTVPVAESATASWVAYLALDVGTCQGCLLLGVVSWTVLQSSSDTLGY